MRKERAATSKTQSMRTMVNALVVALRRAVGTGFKRPTRTQKINKTL